MILLCLLRICLLLRVLYVGTTEHEKKYPYFIIMFWSKYMQFQNFIISPNKEGMLIPSNNQYTDNFEKNRHFTKAIIHFYLFTLHWKFTSYFYKVFFFIKIYFFTKVYALI